MTVTSATNKVSYSGNGSTTVFAYSFKIFDQDDLTVILRSATGTETTQTITTHYTVSGVGSASGGNVTMGTAPASGTTLTILREQPLTQGLDLVANDPFPASSMEDSLDKLTMQVQTLDEEIGRAIKASKTNTITSTEFTVSATDRANKVFSFDGSGELAVTQELGTLKGNWAASTAYVVRDLVKDTSTNNIFMCITAHTSSGSQPLTSNTDSAKWSLIVDAAAAATSATAAATSATAAASSATAAASSASSASTQASNASSSASTASTQATNAASSASAAATSATAAAAALDEFTDVYLGAKSSDPSTDNDGNALTAGDLYFNTTSDTLMVYTGSAWTAAALTASDFIAVTGGTISGANKLQFRDTGLFINSSADGQLDVDADTELEITAPTVDLNGTLTVSGDTTLEDGADLITASAGTSNFRAGVNAGNSIASGGNYNVLIGDEAGTALTTGDDNVAIGFEALKTEDEHGRNVAVGYQSLKTLNAGALAVTTTVGYKAGTSLTTGVQNTLIGGLSGDALTDADYNVAVGNNTLTTDTKGSKSTAIGYEALAVQNFTTSTDSNNTAVGYQAGASISTGLRNTLVGSQAGDTLTDADDNIAVGAGALGSDTKGNKSVALGKDALGVQNFTSSTDTYNVGVGHLAGGAITVGQKNTFIGTQAGDAITDSDANVAIGFNALGSDTLGTKSVAIGESALFSQNFTSATTTYNTAVGTDAGVAVTTGVQNTLIGASAGDSLTDADYNTAVGFDALAADTRGSKSTAMGRSALSSQNFTSATDTYNTGFGYFAGAGVTTGKQNTIVGGLAADALTTGTNNVAMGYLALSTETAGDNSVAIGRSALNTQNNTSGGNIYNTAVGHSAGKSVTVGTRNTLIGAEAGDAITTGTKQTALGYKALGANTDGVDNVALGDGALTADTRGCRTVAIGRDAFATQNFTSPTDVHSVAVGYAAGQQVTTGDKNTLIGSLAGDAITTGSNNTLVGMGTEPSSATSGSEIVLGKGTIGLGGYNFTFGKDNGSDRVYNQFSSNATFTRVSDERYKKEIQTNTDCGLDFINDLRTVTFKFKAKSEIPDTLPDYDAEATTATHTDKLYGVIAQEVKAALDTHNITDFGGHHEDPKTGIQGVAQSMFIYPLIKAVQELSAKNAALEARITTLEG
jgi:hypothetical protein